MCVRLCLGELWLPWGHQASWNKRLLPPRSSHLQLVHDTSFSTWKLDFIAPCVGCLVSHDVQCLTVWSVFCYAACFLVVHGNMVRGFWVHRRSYCPNKGQFSVLWYKTNVAIYWLEYTGEQAHAFVGLLSAGSVIHRSMHQPCHSYKTLLASVPCFNRML